MKSTWEAGVTKKKMSITIEFNDALTCCVKTQIESWVMDYHTSFHANP